MLSRSPHSHPDSASVLFFSLLLLAFFVVFAACTRAAYPVCTDDGDCKLGEFCVQKLCQLCRGDDDCPYTDRCINGDCIEQGRR